MRFGSSLCEPDGLWTNLPVWRHPNGMTTAMRMLLLATLTAIADQTIEDIQTAIDDSGADIDYDEIGGVLTPKGQLVLEPSMQFSNSQINRLSFTLSLYQAEKTMDESIQEKIDNLKDHISELELRARQLPRAIRKLKAQHRKLRSSEHAPH